MYFSRVNPKVQMFVVDALDRDGHLFWECMFPRPIHFPHRREFLRIALNGPVVYFGMACCLVSPPELMMPLGQWLRLTVRSMSLNAQWEVTSFSLVPLGALCGKPTDVDYMTEMDPAAPNLWTASSRDSINHPIVAIAISAAFIQSPSGVFDDHSSGHCQGSRWQ